MQLFDLPVEVLLKAIPVKENLLAWPIDVICKCMNLLPQIDMFELLVEVAYGTDIYKKASLSKSAIGVNSNPREVNILWSDVRRTMLVFARKLEKSIYVTTEDTIDAEFYKKYIFFDFGVVKHLAVYYYFIQTVLQIRTGDEHLRRYLVLPYYSLRGLEPFRELQISFPPKSDFILKPGLFNLIYGKIFQIIFEEADWFWRRAFINVHTIELNLSVKEYLRMTAEDMWSIVYLTPAPRVLRMYLRDENQMNNAIEDKWLEDNDTTMLSAHRVERVIELARVRLFSLQYSGSNTKLINVYRLICIMPFVAHFSIRFDGLDIGLIPNLLCRRQRQCYIQMKIDKASYRAQKSKHEAHNWDTHVFEDFVVLNCVHNGYDIVPFSVMYPNKGQRICLKRFRKWLGFRTKA